MNRNGIYYVWEKAAQAAYLTANFSTKELECPCTNASCQTQKIAVALMDKLQAIRNETDSVLRVHSAYRCRAYQASLTKRGYETAKGVSQHELGNAADISSSALTAQLLKPHAKRHFRAVGTAANFLHVDLRDDKDRAWSYTLPVRIS